jgi:hypothetical protein
MPKQRRDLPVLGWREWVAFPGLGVPKIECKVDTGARTSALHAYYVEEFEQDGAKMVRFGLHPRRKDTEKEIHCVCEVADERVVSDSGGHREKRYVIKTHIVLGEETWPIELTLTNRDTMRFRMLLGRSAMADNFIVDPSARHLMGKPSRHPIASPVIGRRHDEEEE